MDVAYTLEFLNEQQAILSAESRELVLDVLSFNLFALVHRNGAYIQCDNVPPLTISGKMSRANFGNICEAIDGKGEKDPDALAGGAPINLGSTLGNRTGKLDSS